MAIPAVLVFFIRRKKDTPFPFVFWLFGSFILLCGLTHLMEVITTHVPVYRLSALVKVATGFVSLATVAYLVPLVPKALALRSPEALEREVRERTAELDAANAALRQVTEELDRRVRDRTTELEAANNTLRGEVAVRARIEDELRRSNQELERFASVASHDLQEPLRKIQQFGDLMVQPDATAVDREGYVKRMRISAERMRTLITDLLTLARVTSEAKPFVSVDLGKVVREVVSDLEPRARQTGGRVDVGELPTVDADPTQVRQLFQNLIGNALKFHTPGRPPVVTVRGEILVAPDGEVACELNVSDNGIGFDPKYLDRIFEVFQRLHGRDQYEGTGIGLAVCRKVVERHGGTIAAHSAPGQGATFTVTLPVRQLGSRS